MVVAVAMVKVLVGPLDVHGHGRCLAGLEVSCVEVRGAGVGRIR